MFPNFVSFGWCYTKKNQCFFKKLIIKWIILAVKKANNLSQNCTYQHSFILLFGVFFNKLIKMLKIYLCIFGLIIVLSNAPSNILCWTWCFTWWHIKEMRRKSLPFLFRNLPSDPSIDSLRLTVHLCKAGNRYSLWTESTLCQSTLPRTNLRLYCRRWVGSNSRWSAGKKKAHNQ